MARARNIKPGFFKDPDLADAGPIAQLLFAGLWCLADREGRVKDDERRIKAELFPYYDVDVNRYLTVLSRLGHVKRYDINDQCVIEVVNFEKHQSPHHTERASDLPARTAASRCYHDKHEINGSLTVNSRKSNGENPSDSLIPDFLIPEDKTPPKFDPQLTESEDDTEAVTSLSLSRSEQIEKTKAERASVAAIIELLNIRTGRNFRADETNTRLIVARFREGYTEAELRGIVALKVRAWLADDKMAQYLRPATLFGKTNCAQYVAELGPRRPMTLDEYEQQQGAHHG